MRETGYPQAGAAACCGAAEQQDMPQASGHSKARPWTPETCYVQIISSSSVCWNAGMA